MTRADLIEAVLPVLRERFSLGWAECSEKERAEMYRKAAGMVADAVLACLSREDPERVERAARAMHATEGGACRACNGTGFMEDGPAGATYSAPCSYCRSGIPNRFRGLARAALDAAGPVVVERPAGSPFSPEEIEMLLWATWPFVKTEWPHGRGLYTTLPPAGPECLLSARAKLEGWRS